MRDVCLIFKLAVFFLFWFKQVDGNHSADSAGYGKAYQVDKIELSVQEVIKGGKQEVGYEKV